MECLRFILESMGDGLIATDLNGHVILMNQVAEELTGWKKEEAIGNPVSKIYHIINEATKEPVTNPVEKVLIENKVKNLANHTLLIAKDGKTIAIADSAMPIRSTDDTPEGIVLVFRDVTKERKTAARLKQSEAKYKKLALEYEKAFNGTQDAMCIIDVTVKDNKPEFGYRRFNMSAITEFSILNEDFAFDEINRFFSDEVTEFTTPKQLYGATIGTKIEKYCHDCYTSKKNISFKYEQNAKVWHTVLVPIIENRRVNQIVSSSRDITHQHQAEKEIKYLSYHDTLTGLHNRAYLDQQLTDPDIKNKLPMSIIVGDVNGLKLANDAFGHHEGDKLLRRTADILKCACRKDDIIARCGGDEFTIILPKTTERDAMKIIRRIKKECLQYAHEIIQPSIALGITTKKNDDEDIYDLIKVAESRMYTNKLLEGKSARSSIISSLKRTVWEKNHETGDHTQRLQELALGVGTLLGMSSNELDELNLLAALHDIGKVGIPDHILLKPGPLSTIEWDTMKKHCEIGYRIAQSSPDLTPIATGIFTHHERWDGTGYPQGLQGKEIPLIARIIAVVDAYDVMTHERPYKKAVSHIEAIKELKRCAGQQFDSKIVALFIASLTKPDWIV